jgi:probable rRNA maturation factor
MTIHDPLLKNILNLCLEDERWSLKILDPHSFFFDSLVKTCKKINCVQFIEVTLLLSYDLEVKELNKIYRNKDKPTNVLSFPLLEPQSLDFSKKEPSQKKVILLGDIALSYDRIEEEHENFCDHARHLFIHGLLHLFGYDHILDQDAKTMEEIEIDILASYSIKNPYL